MGAPRLILASSSPYRRRLLERLGLPFESCSPEVDEPAFGAGASSPRELAVVLAAEKSRCVQSQRPDAVVIGSDQVCAVGDQVFGKPGSAAAAVEQLLALQGRAHQLLTAVCVRGPDGREVAFVDTATLVMRPWSRAHLEAYVEADQPQDCAGAYKLEERGIALFERIASDDHTAIVGLPLLRLTQELEGFGFAVLGGPDAGLERGSG